MSGTFHPYATAEPYISGPPAYIPEDDINRIGSYQFYEELYWNFDRENAVIRDDNENPIIIPNPMVVCDTTSHFLLKALHVDVNGPDEAQAAFQAFLRRERFYSTFLVAKRSGVVRGDWLLHLTADSEKMEGHRLSLNSVDPASYFPITDDDDLDRIVRVHLVEEFTDGDGEQRVRKLTYWYEGEGDTRQVMREEGVYDLTEWQTPEAAPVRVVHPPEALPSPIRQIPVYHLHNKPWQGQPFGSSEIRGFEALFRGVNQTVSDEDLALALEGLGVYTTDADQPTNDAGNEIPWVISPGRVVKHGTGKTFKRISGIDSVTPFQDHVEFLENKLFQASGTTDVAVGSVDSSTAESGIALAIRFLPTLAKLEERDQLGLDVLTQLCYDWLFWWAAYEGSDWIEQTTITPTIGDKLPTNRAAKREELNAMVDRQIISRAYYRREMEKLGYVFPDEDGFKAEIISEQQSLIEALDTFTTRIGEEAAPDLDDRGEEEGGEEGE